jgi:hypothetical protein
LPPPECPAGTDAKMLHVNGEKICKNPHPNIKIFNSKISSFQILQQQ